MELTFPWVEIEKYMSSRKQARKFQVLDNWNYIKYGDVIMNGEGVRTSLERTVREEPAESHICLKMSRRKKEPAVEGDGKKDGKQREQHIQRSRGWDKEFQEQKGAASGWEGSEAGVEDQAMRKAM